MEREDVDLDKNAPFLFGLLLVVLVDLLRRRLLPLTLVLLLSERFLFEIEFRLLHFPRNVSMLKPANFRVYCLWCEFLEMEDWSKMLFQIFFPTLWRLCTSPPASMATNGTGT